MQVNSMTLHVDVLQSGIERIGWEVHSFCHLLVNVKQFRRKTYWAWHMDPGFANQAFCHRPSHAGRQGAVCAQLNAGYCTRMAVAATGAAGALCNLAEGNPENQAAISCTGALDAFPRLLREGLASHSFIVEVRKRSLVCRLALDLTRLPSKRQMMTN